MGFLLGGNGVVFYDAPFSSSFKFKNHFFRSLRIYEDVLTPAKKSGPFAHRVRMRMKAKKSTTKHVLPKKKSHMGKKPGKKIAISFTVLAGRAMEASTYVTCEQQYYTHM